MGSESVYQLYALDFEGDKCYSVKTDADTTYSYMSKHSDFIGSKEDCKKEIAKRNVTEVYGDIND